MILPLSALLLRLLVALQSWWDSSPLRPAWRRFAAWRGGYRIESQERCWFQDLDLDLDLDSRKQRRPVGRTDLHTASGRTDLESKLRSHFASTAPASAAPRLVVVAVDADRWLFQRVDAERASDIPRILLARMPLLRRCERALFLTVDYVHPDMDDSIELPVPPAAYVVGNHLLCVLFVERALQHQAARYVLDARYSLHIVVRADLSELQLGARDRVVVQSHDQFRVLRT